MNKRQKKKLYKKITGSNPQKWMQYRNWLYHSVIGKPFGGKKKIQKQNRDNVNNFAKRTPPDVEAMIVQLYEEGQSVRNLAAEFGMRASTVEAIVDRNGAVREKKEPSKLMTETEKIEWNFLTALLRGDLKIVRTKRGE